MALERGKFGIEYNPRRVRDDSPSALKWIVALVVVAALGSLVWTLVSRAKTPAEEPPPERPSARDALPPAPPPPASPKPKARPAPSVKTFDADNDRSLSKRPVKVRNLLMRLEEAERTRDIEMAVTTIETIRALPGSPAADLDDALARRLGKLNMRRLFSVKNAQWVKSVTVKRGDSATRIAREHGSTLASLKKLNVGSVDKLNIGDKLYVMNHPRFNLVIRKRLKTADLSLNGKFFNRYDLDGEITGVAGAYELPEKRRRFWNEIGVRFKSAAKDELDTLLPTGAGVIVSEM